MNHSHSNHSNISLIQQSEGYPGFQVFSYMMFFNILCSTATLYGHVYMIKSRKNVKWKKLKPLIKHKVYTDFIMVFNSLIVAAWAVIGFDRRRAVDGPLTTGKPTLFCRIQAVSITFIGLATYGTCVMLALFQYWSVIWHMPPSQRKKKISQVYRYFTPMVVLPTVATAFVDSGPLAAYCWIRCDEYGVDTALTNHGFCWVRLVIYYIWLFILGLVCIVSIIWGGYVTFF